MRENARSVVVRFIDFHLAYAQHDCFWWEPLGAGKSERVCAGKRRLRAHLPLRRPPRQQRRRRRAACQLYSKCCLAHARPRPQTAGRTAGSCQVHKYSIFTTSTTYIAGTMTSPTTFRHAGGTQCHKCSLLILSTLAGYWQPAADWRANKQDWETLVRLAAAACRRLLRRVCHAIRKRTNTCYY